MKILVSFTKLWKHNYVNMAKKSAQSFSNTNKYLTGIGKTKQTHSVI